MRPALPSLLIGLMLCGCGGKLAEPPPPPKKPSGLELRASLSSHAIQPAAPVSVTVTIRNRGFEIKRVLPMQLSEWAPLRLVFSERPEEDPGYWAVKIGTEPRRAGLTCVRPVNLLDNDSLTGEITLGSSLFAHIGNYRFRVVYEVDSSAARAFGLPEAELWSEELQLKVSGEPFCGKPQSPEPGWFPWPWGYYVDLDGSLLPFPRTNRRIDDRRLKEIDAIVDSVLDADRKENWRSVVRLVPFVRSEGFVIICPMMFGEKWCQLVAHPRLMQALRQRMLRVKAALAQEGIEVYLVGNYIPMHWVCGNDRRFFRKPQSGEREGDPEK